MEASKKGATIMSTKFKYPMYSDVDEDNHCHINNFPYYHNLAEVSMLDINGREDIEVQWRKLDDDQRWREFTLSMEVVLDLYGKVGELVEKNEALKKEAREINGLAKLPIVN